MGLQELMLLAMILFLFSSPASLAPLTKNIVSENIQENKINHSNYTTAIRASGGGGRSTGDGGNGNGGQDSNFSPQGGGNGVVPVYAAGATTQRRNHKGGDENDSPCLKAGLVALVATSASLVLYIFT